MAVNTANQNVKSLFSAETINKALVKGGVAGLVGGSVFGVQMTVGGMLPMVADMIGSTSIIVGFALHMLISFTIGVTYAFAAEATPNFLPTWPKAISLGIVWGIVWWVLGALIMMPLILGMNEMVLEVGEMQEMSLVGHVMFGIIAASFYAIIRDTE